MENALSMSSWEWNPVYSVIHGVVAYFAQCHLHLLSSASPDFCIAVYTLCQTVTFVVCLAHQFLQLP